ncbi:MAG: DUF2062 domain-containing protein [Halopenitus sp.]
MSVAIRTTVEDPPGRRPHERVLHRVFAEERSSQEVADSFALGVFITMLPTLGVGFLAFLALAFVFERPSTLALFASVIVFNPAVKWGFPTRATRWASFWSVRSRE